MTRYKLKWNDQKTRSEKEDISRQIFFVIALFILLEVPVVFGGARGVMVIVVPTT